MHRPDRQIVRVTTALAAIVAIAVGLAIPAAHFDTKYRYQTSRVRAGVDQLGVSLSAMVSRNPLLWRFETERLTAILPDDRRTIDLHRIFDDAGKLVAERPAATADLLAFPRIVAEAPIYNSGEVVGRIEVVHTLRPLLLITALAGLVGLAVAVIIFLIFRELPLRALRRATEKISYLASHDALTGLPNRDLFRDRLEQSLEHARRWNEIASVLLVDLDNFKDINDTLGHSIGDRLLRETGQRMYQCLRKSDTLARLGSDEFAIIQSGLRQPEDAALLAQRILEAMRLPFTFDRIDVLSSASIGIAVFKSQGDAEQLLKQADLSLNRAKSEGRSTYRYFEEEMNIRLQARKGLEHDLRRALVEGQFEVYYQPQIAVDSGQVIGVEALIRWHHPQRGMVPPLDFIPLAEETGLIVPIGEWVLHTACAEAEAWRPLRLAVNLSPAQFRKPGLELAVARVLGETGFEPGRLELEITEGVVMHDSDATLSTLNTLKSLGVHIAMDDFGTGYSSLNYLQRFPFDKIKIDRSFIRDLGRSQDSLAIVRAIIALGQSLGMRINAEGVETEDQAFRLRREGCEEMQGFLFAVPMPAAELRAFLASWPARGVVAAQASLRR